MNEEMPDIWTDWEIQLRVHRGFNVHLSTKLSEPDFTRLTADRTNNPELDHLARHLMAETVRCGVEEHSAASFSSYTAP